MYKRAVGMLAGLLCLLFSMAALGQDKDANIVRVYVMNPKAGMTKQFEAGRKRHMAWHQKQNDTWGWETWQTETGPQTGSYLSVTGPHTWKDYDDWEAKLGAADTADGEVNMTAYTGDGGDNGFWMYMKDWSRPIDMNMTPPKLAQVNHFMLKPGSTPEFNANVKKIGDALDKGNWPGHYAWYTLQDGGAAPHYVLLVYLSGWAEMAEPQPGFMETLAKQMGKDDAEAAMKAVDACIEREWSETIRYRADLSYRPASK